MNELGELYDTAPVFHDLFRVRSSEHGPRQSYAKVRYEDHWYYIDRRAIDSKETLTLLMAVFTLQAGGAPGGGPVLTLPVTGGR